jgi:hypothetical protein
MFRTRPNPGAEPPPGRHDLVPSMSRLSRAAALSVLLIAACTGLERREFRPLTDARFDPREQPAEVSGAPPAELSARGYLLIGVVEVRQELRRCMPERCIDQSYAEDATAHARRLAAEHGGDLIVLEKNNARERETFEEIGRCRVPMMRGPVGPFTRAPFSDDCLEYERIRGVKELRVAQGFVWRLEPGQARSPEGRLGRRVFSESSE